MAYSMTLKKGSDNTAAVSAEGSLRSDRRPKGVRRTGMLLWIVQGLLALLFLFTGGMKLALPLEVLTAQIPLPGLFVRFVGLAEFAGALGLILPGLTHIGPRLTPLAASGLLVIMAGATIVTLLIGGGATALLPLAVGILAAFVACGRFRLLPR